MLGRTSAYFGARSTRFGRVVWLLGDSVRLCLLRVEIAEVPPLGSDQHHHLACWNLHTQKHHCKYKLPVQHFNTNSRLIITTLVSNNITLATEMLRKLLIYQRIQRESQQANTPNMSQLLLKLNVHDVVLVYSSAYFTVSAWGVYIGHLVYGLRFFLLILMNTCFIYFMLVYGKGSHISFCLCQ